MGKSKRQVEVIDKKNLGCDCVWNYVLKILLYIGSCCDVQSLPGVAAMLFSYLFYISINLLYPLCLFIGLINCIFLYESSETALWFRLGIQH